jgi:OFA family oxalate/formate antiporter-like MFS transporter
MRKYTVLAAAVAIHLCLGGIYAWSVFVPVLRHDFGYSSAQSQFVFGLTVAVLCATSLVGGRMQDLMGPRLPACLSAVLLGSGYLFAGAFGDRFWGLVIGISVLCGIGVGFGYITSIATAAKWFPGKRGMATGIVVSGYGCAAILLSAFAETLLTRKVPVLEIFRTVGFVYGAVVLVAAFVLHVPPPAAATPAATGFDRRALLSDGNFWRVALGVACATYPGLALIGSLKPVGLWHGLDAVTATASISALAVGNGAGRVAWGMLHDRLRNRHTVLLLLGAVVISVLVYAAGGLNRSLFLASAFALGFCYGGSLAVFPAEVAAIYGIHVMGSVYPLALLLHGGAAVVAAPLTGIGVDLTGSYWPGIGLSLVVAAVGLLLCIRLSPASDSNRPG